MDIADISDVAAEAPEPAASPKKARTDFPPVAWKDPRFQPAIDSVRSACGFASSDREDDPMIGMLLDRYSWDEQRVCELYRKSVQRRHELGLEKVKREIVSEKLALEQLPHAAEVRQVISINGTSSVDKVAKTAAARDDVLIDGKQVAYGDVIGCYEMRYGHGTGSQAGGGGGGGLGSVSDRSLAEPPVTPDMFTRYMVYVTQWRWLQCEEYIRRHGELGFWSMIHDCSCPAGYIALWSRMRSLLGQYMPPVEEACAGLFPPMVQKILIINVPRVFSPIWSVVARFLPQHHKDRIVLLSTSYTSAEEVSKYVPEAHMPPHLREGRPDGPD